MPTPERLVRKVRRFRNWTQEVDDALDLPSGALFDLGDQNSQPSFYAVESDGEIVATAAAMILSSSRVGTSAFLSISGEAVASTGHEPVQESGNTSIGDVDQRHWQMQELTSSHFLTLVAAVYDDAGGPDRQGDALNSGVVLPSQRKIAKQLADWAANGVIRALNENLKKDVAKLIGPKPGDGPASSGGT